jgi:hypothetical protein
MRTATAGTFPTGHLAVIPGTFRGVAIYIQSMPSAMAEGSSTGTGHFCARSKASHRSTIWNRGLSSSRIGYGFSITVLHSPGNTWRPAASQMRDVVIYALLAIDADLLRAKTHGFSTRRAVLHPRFSGREARLFVHRAHRPVLVQGFCGLKKHFTHRETSLPANGLTCLTPASARPTAQGGSRTAQESL